jgi:hypothetical protein
MSRKLLIGEVSLEDLVARLAFAQEETPSAAVEQAKLFMAAADYRIKKMKIRQEADASYEDLRIHRSLQLRATNAKGKLTERHLNDLVDRDPKIQQARDDAATAKRREEWAKLLLEAYDHRRSTLKILTQFAFMEDNFRGGADELERLRKKKARLKSSLPDKEDALI